MFINDIEFDEEGEKIVKQFIDIKLGTNTFPFVFNEENIEYINDNDYNREFLIQFAKNTTLQIPQTFKIMGMTLDLKLKYVIDLAGGE
jgi:hypothetical protein